MFLLTSAANISPLYCAKISPLCCASLNDDVWSRDRQRIFSTGLELPCPRIRSVSRTRVRVGAASEGHLYFGLIEHQGPMDTDFMMSAIDNELSKIVGLDALKVQLRKWFKGMLLDERRRAFGLSVGPRRLPQLAFLGNPGTGKTMIARMLSKLLHMVGILPKNKIIEVQRTDLVGQHIGDTGPQTREKIKKAVGGILFVDEAYRLAPKGESSKDYGIEALEEIMSFMDKGTVVVIFAGYTKPMESVISSNEGMRRRISNIFHFDDFSCEELAKIVHLKLPSKDKNSPFYGFKLDSRATSVEDVAALIKGGTSAEQRRKMNGGLVDQILIRARENLDTRISFNCRNEYSMVTITSEDLIAGLRLLSAEGVCGNDHQMLDEELLAEESDNVLLDKELLAEESDNILLDKELPAEEFDHVLLDKEKATRAGLESEVKALKSCGPEVNPTWTLWSWLTRLFSRSNCKCER